MNEKLADDGHNKMRTAKICSYESPEKYLFQIGQNGLDSYLRNIKSYITIGENDDNVILGATKKFNWFQRMMWKIFFGATVTNEERKDKK